MPSQCDPYNIKCPYLAVGHHSTTFRGLYKISHSKTLPSIQSHCYSFSLRTINHDYPSFCNFGIQHQPLPTFPPAYIIRLVIVFQQVVGTRLFPLFALGRCSFALHNKNSAIGCPIAQSICPLVCSVGFFQYVKGRNLLIIKSIALIAHNLL